MFAVKMLFVMLLLSLSAAVFAGPYQDPRKRFKFDVPEHWSVVATDDGALASDGAAAYARIVQVKGGGGDTQLIRRLSEQVSSQWQNFKKTSTGDFTLSGRQGFYVFFTGINPKGIPAIMRIVAAPDGNDAYVMIMSFPAADLSKTQTPLQHIENSFTLPGGKPATTPQTETLPGDAGETSANPGGWKEHYDSRLHAGISLPTGWSIKTEGYTLTAQSADHASAIVVEAFVARPGETAQSVLHHLGMRHATLLPHAQITKSAPQPGAGDTQMAALAYKNPTGKKGQARALCSVYQNSGMLYAIAAPDAQFEQQRPTLLKALQSLRFGAPSEENTLQAAAGGAHGQASGADRAGTRLPALKFVRWTDPKEHAFTADVPAGWTVTGGANRVAPTHVNQWLQVESPDHKMFVRIYTPDMPLFLDPTPDVLMMYGNVREGVPFNPTNTFMNMILPHMSAPAFNKWYLNRAVKPNTSELTVTKEENSPDVVRQLSEQAQNAFAQMAVRMRPEITAATTEFKGVNKATGEPFVGVAASCVLHSLMLQRPSMNSWQPVQLILATCTADADVEQRQTILRAVIERMNRTWLEDPAWTIRFQQQQQAGTDRVIGQSEDQVKIARQQWEATLAATKQRTQQIADTREHLMSSYWKRVGAQSEMQRQQANYYGDQTDVRNPSTGETAKVSSGYSNYYHDPRTGTILGTNSATRPPVDFTPMQQF